MNPFKNNEGFMLTESIVTSVLATIIGFIIFSVATVYTNESSASISRFVMQQQYDNVASQIAGDVHRASFVGAEGETPNAHRIGFDTVASIQLLDQSARIFAHYSIINDALYEGIPQRLYLAGGGAIHVAGATSFFIIGPQRRTLALHLTLCKTERNKIHTLSLRKAVFVCRN